MSDILRCANRSTFGDSSEWIPLTIQTENLSAQDTFHEISSDFFLVHISMLTTQKRPQNIAR